VWGLELFGPSLGGPESARWVGVLEAFLTGWIVYVAAAGMLFEGLVLCWWRRRLVPDLPVAAAAVGMFLWSGFEVAVVVLRASTGRTSGADLPGPLFHWCVLLLATWSAFQWWRMK